MKWMGIRQLMSVSAAIGMLAVSSGSASGQILDRVFGGGTRTRIEEQPIERHYRAPAGEQDEFHREGRVYRGTEVYGDSEIRGEGEYRSGERTHVRTQHARRGSTLIGSSVRLDGGRSMGRVEDIVISESGCVEFLVVSVSGLRGLSGRYAVLPFGIGEADFSRRTVYIDWTEEDLRRAPIFFSSHAWPDFTDSRWTGEVFAYFEMESHDEQIGRAYREPRDMERGRSDERSRSRESREFDREDPRSFRDQELRGREGIERSTRERDSFNQEQNRSRSESRSRNREMSEDDQTQSGDQRSRSRSRDQSSGRDASKESKDSKDSSDSSDSERSKSGTESDSEEDSKSKSSDQSKSKKDSNLPD